jgi:hypothetical protein
MTTSFDEVALGPAALMATTRTWYTPGAIPGAVIVVINPTGTIGTFERPDALPATIA